MADHDRIARRIADQLFTNGQGEKATRLILVREDHLAQARLQDPARDLGGLSRTAVEDRIIAVLEEPPF